MRRLSEIIGFFDAWILRLFPNDEIQARYKEFHDEAALSGNIQQSKYEALDSLDTKATAVLQHVSIMIAVTTVLFSQTESWIRRAFGGEVLVYVILALLCLRLLMPQKISPQFNDIQDIVGKEALFDFTSKATFVVTIFLVATVIVEMVYK